MAEWLMEAQASGLRFTGFFLQTQAGRPAFLV